MASWRGALIALLLACVCATSATADIDDDPFADDDGLPAPPPVAAFETWAGGEATRNVWSIYSGLTWAPFGPVRADGWRLRVGGGYGQYRYRTAIDGISATVYGAVSFTDLLVGYHATFGALTVKAFAGGSFDGHLLEPFDPGNRVNDAARGAKAAVELWYNVTDKTWAALDLSAASAHRTYASRLRIGHRVLDGLSLGLEAGAFGNLASRDGRAGGFVRYEWASGEVSASGGVTGDIARPRTPYATVVYLTRF